MSKFRLISNEALRYIDINQADGPFDYAEVLNAMAIDLATEALIRRLQLTLQRQTAAVAATTAQLEAAMRMRDAQLELPVDPKPPGKR